MVSLPHAEAHCSGPSVPILVLSLKPQIGSIGCLVVIVLPRPGGLFYT